MRILRRLLSRARTVALLLPLLSCGYPKPSPKELVAALDRSSTFASPFAVTVPSFVDAQTDEKFGGGGTLDDTQLSRLDAALGVLHANHLVDVRDSYGPNEEGGYRHLLTVTPSPDAPAGLFERTDEPYPETSFVPRIRRVPGWRVALAMRKVVSVERIIDHGSPEAERLSPGYVLARFSFRLIPTDVGELFDQASDSFDQLPASLQNVLMDGMSIDTRRTEGGRAWLTRGTGKDWRVTLFDCPRCPLR